MPSEVALLAEDAARSFPDDEWLISKVGGKDPPFRISAKSMVVGPKITSDGVAIPKVTHIRKLTRPSGLP